MVENMGEIKGGRARFFGGTTPFEGGPWSASQTVVEQLEEGDLPLERSLAMFEEGRPLVAGRSETTG